MTVRLYHDFETQNQSPKNSREREDDTFNKSGSNTKFFILGFVLCIMIFSINSSNQEISQYDLVGNIRFDILYDAKESRKDDVHHNVTVQLSSSVQPGEINTTNAREIQVLLPPEQIQWMRNRTSNFDSFYEVPFDNKDVEERLYAPADNNGPILDFVVAGFPKCGTTTLMANLAQLAPMPENQDVCTPASRTVLYAYKNWPKQYGELKNSSNFTLSTIDRCGKLFRSSKCPQFIEEGWVQQFNEFLPKTKLIVGIRHPVLWFLSFWNMQDKKTPNELTGICPCNVNARGLRVGKACRRCRLSCPDRELYCLGRARFHLPLARLGKTTLSEEERRILAPHDIDGGKLLVNFNISNPIFLYDQTELREGYLWKELSEYLGVSHIPNSKFQGSVGQGRNFTLCDPLYDDFRSRLMSYSYELSTWLQRYFLPVANNPTRPDVRVADVERLTTIVRSYKKDPCNRLVRTGNGTYVLNHTFFGSIEPVTP